MARHEQQRGQQRLAQLIQIGEHCSNVGCPEPWLPQLRSGLDGEGRV
jgi:hypothetical protein